MRERTETRYRKGMTMDLGNVIRVLEVPAIEPAEAIPAHAPDRTPEHAPSEPSREPAAPARQSSADLVPVPARRRSTYVFPGPVCFVTARSNGRHA